MATRTIIWTTLPRGVSDAGRPLLSVHIAPRLVPDAGTGALSAFGEWAHWPLKDLAPWQVEFRSDGSSAETVTFGATVVTVPEADVSLWDALFAGAEVVGRATVENFAAYRLRSYPVGRVLGWLGERYLDMALNSGDGYPSLRDSALKRFVEPVAPQAIEAALQQIEQGNYVDEVAFHFAQLRRFHRRPTSSRGPSERPSLDFHEMLSLAQEHPALLRFLGLVVDLELDVGQFPSGVSGYTNVRVIAGGRAVGREIANVSPWTICRLGPDVFQAEPSAPNGEIGEGFLRLDDTDLFGVTNCDQDSGGLKAMGLAALAARSQARGGAEPRMADALAPSVLRARGLAVYRNDRAASLHDGKFQRALLLDNRIRNWPRAGDVEIFAEDLVQGARFDARAFSLEDRALGPWLSLSARLGSYVFTGTGNPPVTIDAGYDEAKSNTALAGAHDGESDDLDLYLGEEIVAWNGFSLGAARPGRVLNNDDVLQDQRSQAYGFPLEISYKAAPNSLPRLRFGLAYRLRARTVDLAGNSVPLEEPSSAHASPPVPFGRWEPVESPAMLFTTERPAVQEVAEPRGAIDRIVLRTYGDDSEARPLTVERHVAPPKVAPLTAEMHGMFDGLDPRLAYDQIAERETREVPESYGGDTFEVKYLPDPLSFGVTLWGDPDPRNEVRVAWPRPQTNWPILQGVRIVMAEGSNGAPVVRTEGSVIRVWVDKADTLTVRMSSTVSFGRVTHFGLWLALIQNGLATSELFGRIANGKHWMFTPYRELTFVHAVQRPLAAAEWIIDAENLPEATRDPGDTFAVLRATASFSRKSTARIDVEARWYEYLDDPEGDPEGTGVTPWTPGAGDEERATPISAPVSQSTDLDPERWRPDSEAEIPAPGHRHEFGDTKHRTVLYRTRAYSRFDELFRVESHISFVDGAYRVAAPGIVTGSLRLTSASGDPPRVSYVEGVDFEANDDAVAGDEQGGTTITALSGVTSARASWVPRPNDRVSEGWVVKVPSSARPDAPKIAYVVPTFQWEAAPSGLGRKRLGGGLRVYLERPWWSSGGGEMLGVVLAADPGKVNPPAPPNPTRDEPPALERLVTQWGVDPLRRGAPTPYGPLLSSFPASVAERSLLKLPELPNEAVAVAGHAVGFDVERNLWYCDVEVDAGDAYFPFIRLALARWQPESLEGLELSPVVLAEFAQLAADRLATVAATTGGRGGTLAYGVSLTGPAYGATSDEPKGLRAQVTVQVRSPGVDGPLAWRSRGGPVTLRRSLGDGPRVTFTGSISLPKGTAPADARLLFEEFETIWIGGRRGSKGRLGSRIVYADAIELGG